MQDIIFKQMETEISPRRRAFEWWEQLPRLRRIAFAAGLVAYFGSYEYIHDFGVKRRLIAAAGVLLMIMAGGLRPTKATRDTPAVEAAAATGGSAGSRGCQRHPGPADGHDRAAERERKSYQM